MKQTLGDKLSPLFNIKPGEGRLVMLSVAHSFFIGSARIFTRTSAYALFLVEFDAQALPYVYIGISVVVTLLSFAYLKLSERLSFSKLLIANAGFLSLSSLGFRLGLGLTASRWLTFALPIWYEVLWTLTNLEFWNLAGRLFNVRQGKRLFGLIGAGEQAAIIIGGLLAPVAVALIGIPNLLIVAAGSIAGVLVLLLSTSRSYADRLAAPVERTPSGGQKSSPSLLKDRYILSIVGLYALVIVGYFVIDNIFYAQAEVQYPGGDQLAGFIGIFFGLSGLLTLLSRTFLTSLLIGRYGVRLGLLFTPVILTISGVSAATVGTFLGAATAFFWLAALIRFFNAVFHESVDMPAVNVLYQPLPAAQRVQTQTMVEGIVYSLAIGLAGLALSILTALFALGTVQLVYALLVLLLAWIALAILLGREYPQKLVQALARRSLGSAGLLVVDSSGVAILQRELQSSHAGAVIYALNMLEAVKPETLAASLPPLLDHPTPEVRREVLERIERLNLTAALPAVSQRAAREPVVAVRGVAVRTLAALCETEIFETVSAYLDDPVPQVKLGALVGLLRCGGIEGVLAVGHRLLQMASAPEPAERALAAQVLGEVGVSSFYQPLMPLLQDKDLQVRRAALLAAGQLKNPRLWPEVVEGLETRQVRRAAASALAAGGEAVLPELSAAFAQAEQKREVLIELVKVCGRIGGERAIAWLKGQLAHPDPGIRGRVLGSLSRCGYRAQGEEASLIQEQIKAEVALSAEILTTLVDIGEDEAVELLREAIGEALAQSQRRLFFLLSFIYDPRSILQARDNLTLASAQKRAYALEVIDVLVSQEVKRMVLPLLRDLPPGQKLQQLQAFLPLSRRERQQRLREIIAGPPEQSNAWIQVCALYAAGRLPATALSETVVAVLSAPDSLVRETAVWTLCRLDGEEHQRQVGALINDPNPHVARAARCLETDRSGDKIMLTRIEKVIALKKASIFAGTPDETLVELAALLEEAELRAGETLFEKGDLGDCMYVIVDGEVRVHDGEHTLNHLSAGDIFGEMAILDAEPRVASVTAIVDTQLLRLAQEPFYELVDDRIEIARGIIRVLSQLLRARVRDLNEARARLEVTGTSASKIQE